MLTQSDNSNSTEQSDCHTAFSLARTRLGNEIIGQQHLTDSLLIALLADGHLLVEGAPGLAKTRAVKALSSLVEGNFHRVQFTPDLLPSDLTGTDIYQPEKGSFKFQQGPLFHNIILADEINRAPAKVQSALLEAMGERQITIGQTTHPLPELFIVMATQNPIEQEGTYPLPEAQLDRFLLYVLVDYPAVAVEREVMKLARQEAIDLLESTTSMSPKQSPPISQQQVNLARRQVMAIHLSDPMETYIVQLVLATRNPNAYSGRGSGDVSVLGEWVEYGASPRGSISLERTSRAHAWLNGRDYVSPDDVQAVIHDVLRHRIILSFNAEAEGIDTDQFIDRLLDLVPVP